jgi:hypothetical protein
VTLKTTARYEGTGRTDVDVFEDTSPLHYLFEWCRFDVSSAQDISESTPA